MFTKRDICTEKVTIDYSYYCFDEETDQLYKQYIDKNYYIATERRRPPILIGG